eukprot:c14277_g1_i1.p1 GENE.c14277_g1_i1~~c14277_g1_i1.p1  ORF type:complete len:617 (+),score=134.41 c14277_g1_i1:28-1851(+)
MITEEEEADLRQRIADAQNSPKRKSSRSGRELLRRQRNLAKRLPEGGIKLTISPSDGDQSDQQLGQQKRLQRMSSMNQLQRTKTIAEQFAAKLNSLVEPNRALHRAPSRTLLPPSTQSPAADVQYIKDLCDRIEELEEEVRIQDQQLDIALALRDACQGLQDDLTNAAKTIGELMQENDALHEELLDTRQRSLNWQSRVDELKHSHDDLSSEVEGLRADNDELTENLRQRIQEINQLRAKVKTHEKKIEQLECERIELEAVHEAEPHEGSDRRGSEQLDEDAPNVHDSDMEELKRQLNIAVTGWAEEQKTADDLQAKLDTYVEKENDSLQENRRLKANCADLSAQVKRLLSDFDELVKQNKQLEVSIHESEDRNQSLRRELRASKETELGLEEQIEALHAERKQAPTVLLLPSNSAHDEIEEIQVNWNNLNFPPCCPLRHFALGELQRGTVKRHITEEFLWLWILMFAYSITNLATSIVVACFGVRHLGILYSLLNLIALNAASGWLLFVGYESVVKGNAHGLDLTVPWLKMLVAIALVISVGPNLSSFNSVWRIVEAAHGPAGVAKFWAAMCLIEPCLLIIYAVMAVLTISDIRAYTRAVTRAAEP